MSKREELDLLRSTVKTLDGQIKGLKVKLDTTLDTKVLVLDKIDKLMGRPKKGKKDGEA